VSDTVVGAPIVAALVEAERFIGPSRGWVSVNADQQTFLRVFFDTREDLARLSAAELRAWASRDAGELNAVLEREGFIIRIPALGPGEFGVLSILDVLVEFVREGERASVVCDGTSYPAVRLQPAGIVAPGRGDREDPVVVLATRSGDRVCLTVADRPRSGFDLLARIEELRADLDRATEPLSSVVFPMVDLAHEVELDWLVGLHTEAGGDPYAVTYGAQQTKFRMDTRGARVESAAVAGVRFLSVTPADLVVDRPFFCWIERDGVRAPILAAYVDQEHWADPRAL
jgi:hypothetical protein